MLWPGSHTKIAIEPVLTIFNAREANPGELSPALATLDTEKVTVTEEDEESWARRFPNSCSELGLEADMIIVMNQ